MWILMTIGASHRRFGEVYVTHRELKVRRFVAISAANRAMRSRKREAGCVMIELRRILPFLCRVARSTAERVPTCLSCIHATGKLAMMNILMAGYAV